MREYHMPTDISEKEKIVGGLLTAGQLIWLILGIVISLAVGFALYAIMGNGGIVIGALIGIPLGIIFCFVKPHKMPLHVYLKLRCKRRKIPKHLVNHDTSRNIDEVV